MELGLIGAGEMDLGLQCDSCGAMLQCDLYRPQPAGPPMSDDQDEDRPYTEEQWEALFRQSDLKAAKFGELLETLHDQPDHELTIAREMGWTWLVEALEEEAANKGQAPTEPADEMLDTAEEEATDEELIDDEVDEGDDADDSWLDDSADDFDDDDSDVDPWDRRNRVLSQIPAYAAARALASRVSDALRPLMEGEDPDDDRCRLLGEAYITAHQAAVKIAGGHAMGYDDDVLCGNIVNNRISLDAAKRCEQAWGELVEQQIVSREVAEPLVAEMRAVQKLIEERIAELRSRVWW
jgi:hypothetical protein